MGSGRGRPGRRTLSEEEQALWETVAGTARPLDHARRRSGRIDLVGDPPPLVPQPARPPLLGAAGAQGVNVAAPRPAAAGPPSLTGIDRREQQRLRRGRAEVDATLDLHGMTQTRAHATLRGFLHSAQAQGSRTVLVITGKGSPEGARFDTESMWGSGRGILRRLVPEWLAAPDLRPLVSGIADAHVRHGGGGALYVRLRRRRE